MRSLLKFCIDRPRGVLVIYAGVAVAGIFAWRSLPQELVPDLRFPQLSVVTLFPNASPEEVENLVTRPVERMVGTVKNVRQVESVSKEQLSLVTIQFRWDTDMDAALLWVQEKLGLIQDLLPLEARKPEVTRYNPFDRPVLLLAATGRQSPVDLQHLIETRVRPDLEKVRGVSGIEVSGGLEREILIEADAQRLNAHRLALKEVAEALRQRNVSRSAGSAVEGMYEFPVTVTGALDEVKALNDVVVKLEPAQGGGEPARLRLSSVAEVKDGHRERQSHARYDGQDTLSLAVYKRAEAYPLDVSREVRRSLEALNRQWPGALRLDVLYDQSVQIREGISGVLGNVVAGAVMAYGVIFLFLKSHRRSLLIGVTIPLALLVSVLFLWRFKMTLNLLTLGGLALGVGMLVDSAIVIIEDISRQRDMGKNLEDSILAAGDEVGGSVLFSVLTTVAAFAPIPFATVGVAQKVFTPICVTVIVSQLASLVVGFTFVPALAVLVLNEDRPAAFHGGAKALAFLSGLLPRAQVWVARAGQTGRRALGWLLEVYDRSLRWSVAHPGRILRWSLAITLLNGAGLFLIRRESMPDVDQEQFLMRVNLPTGTRLALTDSVAKRIDAILAAVPEVAHRNVVVGSSGGSALGALGPHQAQVLVDLAERVPKKNGGFGRRKRTARQVMSDVGERLRAVDLEGARVEYEAQGADVFSQLFGRGGADLVMEVKAQDLAVLAKTVEEVRQAIRGVPGVARVEGGLTVPSLQILYELDEARLSRDGLTASDVAETVLSGVNGTAATVFREKGKEVPVRVRLREEDRKNAAALSRLVVPSVFEKGAGHPLQEYGRLSLGPGPSEIRRRDQQRVALVSVFLSKRSVDDVLPDLRRALTRWKNRGDVTVDLGSEVEEVRASSRSLIAGFAAAVGLVFIVLVAQFNLLWLSALAMSSVVLAVNGVTPSLLLTGNTLNIMSGQGLMILSGIVVNNAIILLEFIQQRRASGLSPEEAAMAASQTRLRPIFMTAGTSIVGLIPLALGIGRGAALQAPMAIVVISGLLVSTALTLLVLPALYLSARPFFEAVRK